MGVGIAPSSRLSTSECVGVGGRVGVVAVSMGVCLWVWVAVRMAMAIALSS